jgi:hypothetical protein
MKRRRKTVAEVVLLDYCSLTELGILFGTTPNWIGRYLERLGYWVPCGKPTDRAYVEGVINTREYDSGCEFPLNTWHREKTVALLQAHGHVLTRAAQTAMAQLASRHVATPSVKRTTP